MEKLSFTPLEETISFYTRNDFSIINSLLTNQYEKLFKNAQIAYNDNAGILEEYQKGIRKIKSDYDLKWINSLKKRIINDIDENAKKIIIENATNDINIILNSMYPSTKPLTLYRTSWIDSRYCDENSYSFSREYKSISMDIGDIVEIKGITSFSLTPYRENDHIINPFYRYELTIPIGTSILELDQFITCNEQGEVLLPPMKFKLKKICKSNNAKCKGILLIEYIKK